MTNTAPGLDNGMTAFEEVFIQSKYLRKIGNEANSQEHKEAAELNEAASLRVEDFMSELSRMETRLRVQQK